MFSDADAGAIVSMHAKEMEETEQARLPKFSTGIATQNVASGMYDLKGLAKDVFIMKLK